VAFSEFLKELSEHTGLLRGWVKNASVVRWSEFLATDPEIPDSIPGAIRFSEK
jgi:hypothetical protein